MGHSRRKAARRAREEQERMQREMEKRQREAAAAAAKQQAQVQAQTDAKAQESAATLQASSIDPTAGGKSTAQKKKKLKAQGKSGLTVVRNSGSGLNI